MILLIEIITFCEVESFFKIYFLEKVLSLERFNLETCFMSWSLDIVQEISKNSLWYFFRL